MTTLITDFQNLEAWAIQQGYDPDKDYTGQPSLPEGYISEHFRQSEFTCNHCGALHPSSPCPPQQVLEWLEDIRSHFGDRAVNVNSGYRCPTHNYNVGGATSSFHLTGQAVDFWISGVSPVDVYAYADTLIGSAGGVGKYSNFTHIDNRGYKARW